MFAGILLKYETEVKKNKESETFDKLNHKFDVLISRGGTYPLFEFFPRW